MSIASEITSMGENLKKDYQSIANLGADLTNVDKNIENIAELLDGVYDVLPKTSFQEGTEITLSNTLKGKLDYENGIVGIGQSSQDGTPTPSTPIAINSVTGNQDVVVKDGNNNTIATYQLSLGDIELNAIGNYKDELIYDVDEDRVYKKANIKSAILNSTNQTWETQGTNVTTKKRYSTNAFASEIVAPSISSNLGILMCNYYGNQVAGTSGSYGGNQGVSISSNGSIYVNDSRYDNDIDGWKTWLNSVICKVYYALQTPVETEITDTTLINQVKSLYNAQSINGTTIITSNGNLPMVIKVRGLKGE